MRRSAFVVLWMLGVAACSKKSDPAPPSAGASASAAPRGPIVWHLKIAANGTAHVVMQTPKRRIEGDTALAMGSFDVTPTDLAQSRGGVMIDLATFATHAFGSDAGADEAKLTATARAWLEAVGAGKTNESMRWANFAIQSVDASSATDLTQVTPRTEGGEDVRTVTMTVHGDLLIHGRKVAADAVLDVSFRHRAGAPADAPPTRVDIASKAPLRIVLKELDVRPRDVATGKVTALAPAYAGKVADSVDATVSLSATPSN